MSAYSTAYAYGVGEGCALGMGNVNLRRVTPINTSLVTVASTYSNGACSASSGQYYMAPLTAAGAFPSLTAPFTIVTQ